MERIAGIREALREFLPESYTQALAVILQALPKPLDHTKTDNDFGDFIYAPYSYFVATHGCTKENLTISLAGLSEITKRFSAEAALRYFLNAFPDETLREAQRWAKDENYHVRRLASEGTRPNLPWAKKVVIPAAESLKILERLYTDKTRYVTRSVANHLNDLSKTDTSLVVATLRRWQSEGKQPAKELQFITKHALRTAVKRGDSEALSLLGYERPQVTVTNLAVKQTRIIVGEALEFSFTVDTLGTLSQSLSIDYSIHFRKANGSLSPKVFKLQSRTLTPGEVVSIKKSHVLRPMTTRVLYSGEHVLEVHINGQSFGQAVFHLA
jgi:3-methyladenine DNA glycosylase AlkC